MLIIIIINMVDFETTGAPADFSNVDATNKNLNRRERAKMLRSGRHRRRSKVRVWSPTTEVQLTCSELYKQVAIEKHRLLVQCRYDGDEDCTICIGPIKGKTAKYTPCGHVFCCCCLNSWFKGRRGVASQACPNCRTILNAERADMADVDEEIAEEDAGVDWANVFNEPEESDSEEEDSSVYSRTSVDFTGERGARRVEPFSEYIVRSSVSGSPVPFRLRRERERVEDDDGITSLAPTLPNITTDSSSYQTTSSIFNINQPVVDRNRAVSAPPPERQVPRARTLRRRNGRVQMTSDIDLSGNVVV